MNGAANGFTVLLVAVVVLLDGEVRSFDWTPFRYGRFGRRGAAAGRGSGGTGTG